MKKTFVLALIVIGSVFAFSHQTAYAETEADTVRATCLVSSLRTCDLYSVTSNSSTDEVVWKIYEAGGILRATITPYPGYRGGIAITHGDVNGDGSQEWITAPNNGGQLKIWTALGTFINAVGPMPKDPVLATGNFDSNTKDEIVIASRTTGRRIYIYAYQTFSGGFFALHRAFDAYEAPFNAGLDLAVGDVEGDGLDDIVYAAAFGEGDIKVYAHESKTSYFFKTIATIGAGNDGSVLRVGNVFGDEKDEIIVTNRTALYSNLAHPQQVYVYEWDAETSAFTLITEFASYGAQTNSIYGISTWYPFGPQVGSDIVLGDIIGDTKKEIITTPRHHRKGPIAVWQFGHEDIVRVVALSTSLYPIGVRGINVLPINYAPDRDTTYHKNHDELLVIPKAGGGPALHVLRYNGNVRGQIETIWTFLPLHPAFRSETQLWK